MIPGEPWEGNSLTLVLLSPTAYLFVLLGFLRDSRTSSSWMTCLFLLPLSGRSSAVRERNEKPLISTTSSRPGSFGRGGSSKEVLENQNPEESRRDREQEGAEPRRPSVTEDKPELERSKIKEPGEKLQHSPEKSPSLSS